MNMRKLCLIATMALLFVGSVGSAGAAEVQYVLQTPGVV
jgi:hypothetical protein